MCLALLKYDAGKTKREDFLIASQKRERMNG
jgi:hypothetical protein